MEAAANHTTMKSEWLSASPSARLGNWVADVVPMVNRFSF